MPQARNKRQASTSKGTPNPTPARGNKNVVVAGGKSGTGGGRRPATTATAIATEDSTNNTTNTTSTNGNVNNNGRAINNVNVNTGSSSPGAIVQQGGRRISSTTTVSKNKKEVHSEQLLADNTVVILSSGVEELSKDKGKLSGNVRSIDGSGGEDGDGSSPDRSTSNSEEEEPASEECQSFYIIVNPDGTLVLDNNTSTAKDVELGPGQERFPVSLPKNKVKSPTNPLPGAVPLSGQRARKSKPEGVTYGGSLDVGFITSTAASSSSSAGIQSNQIEIIGSSKSDSQMSVGINPAPILQTTSNVSGATGQIDMDEFTNQLDPQSLATLETLIQSEIRQGQEREIIETLDLGQVAGVQLHDSHGGTEPKPPGWDHSYNAKGAGSSKDSSASSVTGSNVGVLSPSSSAANSPGASRRPTKAGSAKARSSTSSRLSEGDAANIRRSQRQQDRIERQEAERIKAENQQMLKREKEIMIEASANKIEPTKTVESPQIPVPSAVPAKIASPIVTVTKPLATSTARDSVDSAGSDRRPYPKRENRKLPAHLADPNYISLDDETKHGKDGTVSERSAGSRRSSVQTKQEQPEDAEVEEDEDENEEGEDEEDEEYTEDDPNRLWCICRQPHNNRFMICCDRCEEWFHGRCVNITKAQGKAMELKEITWNCPNCKKLLLAEKAKKIAEASPAGGRSSTRRGSEAGGKAKNVGRLSKAAAAQQAEVAAAANAAKTALTPEKIAAQSTTVTRRLNSRKSESQSEKSVEEESAHDCVVCGKPSRKNSIYCTDLCVQKHADTVGGKATGAGSSVTSAEKGKPTPTPVPIPSQPATPSTPTSATPNKLKRTNSLKTESKPDEPIFAFHVITPGASKSTEIVPPKPKELTASQLLKAQREQAALAAASGSATPATIHTPLSKSSPTSAPSTSSSQLSVLGISPNSVTAIISSAPTVMVEKMNTADGKSVGKLPGKTSKETPLKVETSSTSDAKDKNKRKEKESASSPVKTRNRNSSVSDAKSKPNNTSSTRKSEKETPKSKKDSYSEKDRGDSERLQKDNMRKGLRELLKGRVTSLSNEEQQKINEGSYTPEIVAEKIADELCTAFGGSHHPKCKAKYRSIYFNLKDSKNSLYLELLLGNLKPKVFVKMEAHEMASPELAEWRKKESEKELDAIKKAELDKFAEVKKQQLLEKGVDDAVKVAEELRPLDISDIIDTSAHVSDNNQFNQDVDKSVEKSKDKSSTHSHSRKDKKEVSSKHSEKDKDRRDKDRRRSQRHKSEKDRESVKDKEKNRESVKEKGRNRESVTEKEKNRESAKEKDRESVKEKDSEYVKEKDRRSTRGREKEKESSKVKHSISSSSDSKVRDKKNIYSKEKSTEKHKSFSSKDDQSRSSSDTESKKSDESEVNTPTDAIISGNSPAASFQTTIVEDKKGDIRQSTDSEQELPSSTIKTPDFTDESSLVKKDSDTKHVFETRIVMPELGGFNASAHAVSHFTTEGIIFPETPVPIVGRIAPETVWDYINKMKKTKEVIVVRLSPATPADSEGYMTFFSYFSSRTRLGVMGGIVHPLKDVYLIPLDKHSPVNRSLLPFGGPGLPKERTHCLLAVITRHVQGDIPASVPLKRKSSVAEQLAKKKVKFGPEQKPRTAPLTRSSTSAISEPPKLAKMSVTVEEKSNDDDDAPYTPWEEEDEKDEVPGVIEPSGSLLHELKPPVLIPEIAAPVQSVDVQKQLQELEAKIAKEKQDIEKITGALAGRNSMSGIPGLDGEFPDGEEGAKKPEKEEDTIPFFLRGPTASTETQVKDSSLDGSTALELSKQESMDVDSKSDSSNDVIIEDKRDSDKLSEDNQKIEPADTDDKLEDSEEAYSPSAMQFSDEESPEVEEMPDITSQAEAQTDDNIAEGDDELSPPGLEVQTKPVIQSEPVDDIKIVLKKPSFASTLAPLKVAGLPASSPASLPLKSSNVVDLADDDLETPPPANVIPPPLPKLTLPTKPDPVFEESGAVFIKPTPSSGVVSIGSHAKMKININLTTKQLPATVGSQKKTDESLNVSQPASHTLPVKSNPLSSPSPTVNQRVLAPVKTGMSIPTHLPPPALQKAPPNLPPQLPNVLQPPPNLQSTIPNLQQPPPPIIPVHIPPPSMTQAPTPPTSVVINLNIPPPPLTQMRPMPNITGPIGFTPVTSGPPPRPFSSIPPPQLSARPNLRPSFIPSFNSPGSNSSIPLPSGNSASTSSQSVSERPMDKDFRRGFEGNRNSDVVERVERVNLDRERQPERRNSSGRNSNRGNIRGRGSFGRRTFGDRGHSERVRRHRTKSRSPERDRSRSRSRERRHRRRHSKSRSKSPLSRRWEARNRSRSRSRSPGGRRNRRRSRSSSLLRRHRRSRSPRRSSRIAGSPSKSKSPSTPSKSRHLSSTDKISKQSDTSGIKESEDWETPSPLRSNEESVEKQSASSESNIPDESAKS